MESEQGVKGLASPPLRQEFHVGLGLRLAPRLKLIVLWPSLGRVGQGLEVLGDDIVWEIGQGHYDRAPVGLGRGVVEEEVEEHAGGVDGLQADLAFQVNGELVVDLLGIVGDHVKYEAGAFRINQRSFSNSVIKEAIID